MASLMDKFIRDDPIGAIEKIAKEQKMANEQIQPKAAWDIPARDQHAMGNRVFYDPLRDEIMANQIQPKAAWDKNPTPQAVYYPPPGAMEGSSIGLNTAKLARPLSLSQRINDKINRLQGQVEELQLIRSKLQAGKLDQLTMDDLFKLVDY